MPDTTPAFPSEEYIAGREHGRIPVLKRTLKVRLRRIAAGAVFGGAFVGLALAIPEGSEHRSTFVPIFLWTLGSFLVLGLLRCLSEVHSYRRSMRHLRDDIVRSVMMPEEDIDPSRLRKWWFRSEASGANPWAKRVRDDANDWHRHY